ncbi:MAG: hypothetical protein JSV42_12065 [Chloroflexota bacterium]|nr:MAG: hypothetical protein JSV42_12065 [Chloroflexota bacterium]
MIEQIPFISGNPPISIGLLSRFLPPVPDGIASKWIHHNLASNALILDPFGSSPELILEAAKTGKTLLVCSNNPIVQFIIEYGADPPSEEDLHAALAELAAARVGEERLELHINQIYQTNCSQCGQSLSASAFVWEREASAPRSKIYECNHCGDSGEHPVTQKDIELAESFFTSPLHRLRVLERIAPPGDAERPNVEEALSVYPPRAIYALAVIINRLDGLLASPPPHDRVERIRDNCLIALVLAALDKGNSLWSYPSGRPRPKQLSSSPRFAEYNVWLVLEEAIDQLASDQFSTPLKIFPEFPEKGNGIILFKGPLRDLCEQLHRDGPKTTFKIDGVMMAIPRHNQAFWTLSALWAGWIWGHGALGSFRSVLRRRRYDWAWHCNALTYAFQSLKKILTDQKPIFGLIPEAEASFINAAGIAIAMAGFPIRGITLRPDAKIAQISCDYPPATEHYHQIYSPAIMEDHFRELIISQGVDNLEQRGEPTPYLSMNTAALMALADNHGLYSGKEHSPADEYSRIHQLIEQSFSFKNGFIRFGGGEKSPENAMIWRQEITNPQSMLTDRVEIEILSLMNQYPNLTVSQLDQLICDRFLGILTPAYDFVTICIESYCSGAILINEKISLREEDDWQKRSQELEIIKGAIRLLGQQLSYSAEGDNPVIWKESGEKVRLVFYISATASVGDILINSPHPPRKSIIVLPGARANLIMYKQQTNFFIKKIIDSGWRFLKFRHLRQLLEMPTLSKDNLDTLLEIDPLTESPAQLRLL